MNDTEIRVRCIEAAVRVPGNPNTIQQAREFYEFATENVKAAEEGFLDGDILDVVTNLSPTKTPFLEAGAGALLSVTAPPKKGSRK